MLEPAHFAGQRFRLKRLDGGKRRLEAELPANNSCDAILKCDSITVISVCAHTPNEMIKDKSMYASLP